MSGQFLNCPDSNVLVRRTVAVIVIRIVETVFGAEKQARNSKNYRQYRNY